MPWWVKYQTVPALGSLASANEICIEDMRLVCFEITEAVRDVQDGKNSNHQQVRCDISYMYYEAQFMMDRWKLNSASVDRQQKEACQDFVERQTVDISP
ncbi:hypothetical protein IG631_00015 [Alternaria alternata]|nr:hypothetical protein IG631_00015 [Alternaria alternata]